jgi:hypothetical protein
MRRSMGVIPFLLAIGALPGLAGLFKEGRRLCA